MRLEIIIASTRPGRLGLPVANWVEDAANKYAKFDVNVADLAEINLPFLDEPNHPRFQQYTKQHTKDWAKRIDAADAYLIVTPEYNYSGPAALINALDYLSHEWSYKPVGFVSYGGISAGTRSVQHIKSVVTTLKLVPVVEAVNIPFVTKSIADDGTFMANESNEKAAIIMFDELYKWAVGLKEMRSKVSSKPATTK
jgi:NAD(P)H-dependent FMN reductase